MRFGRTWMAACVAGSWILNGCDTDAPEMASEPEVHDAARPAPLAAGRPTVSSTVTDGGPTTHSPTRFRGHASGARYAVESARPTDGGVMLRLDIDEKPHTYHVAVEAGRAKARLVRADGRWASLTLERIDSTHSDDRLIIREATDSEFVVVESNVCADGTLVERYTHSAGDTRTWTFPDGTRAGDDWQDDYRHWLPVGTTLTDENPLIASLRELQDDPSLVALLESMGARPAHDAPDVNAAATEAAGGVGSAEGAAPSGASDRLAGFLCVLGVRCTVHACIAAPGSPVCAGCAGAMSVFCLAAWFTR